MRPVAGVDTNIFKTWAKIIFIDETVSLRSGGKKMVLVMDGYAAHISYDML